MTSLTRLAAGIAACLGPVAYGVTVDWATVGNAGNPANVNGWGAVSDTFLISAIETTNTQYAEFLNTVDRSGLNPNGVYDPMMGSDSLGGISFNSGAPSGAKYAVKAGAPAGSPAGTSYAQMPVVFVTWFSAARFTNWLQNGQQANSASMEDGTYPLHNQTSGPIPSRNSGTGSQVALPSRDEWYKSAFYNQASYLTWPCQSNQPPTNTVTDLLRPCAANFGGAATPTVGPINVGSYRNTQSPYGLFDMLGNVTEYTDTAGTEAEAGRVQVFGGSWATPLSEMTKWSALAPPVFRGPTNPTGQIGFRVATVQAVPEPSAAALLAVAAGFAAWRIRRTRPARATGFGVVVAVLPAVVALACFASAPGVAQAARVAGIDVSHYQGTNNWSTIRSAGKSFAWAKADEGVSSGLVDATFTANMINGRSAGMLMGAYHFAHPENNTATAEAAHFLSVVQPNGLAGSPNYLGAGYLRPVVDIETGAGAAVGSANLSAWVNAFITYVITNGGGTAVEPLIYCNTNYAQNFLNSSVASRNVWIANYNFTEAQALGTSNPPIGVFSTWSFWQYSSSLSVSGVGSNPVDTDVANGDITFVRTFLVPEPPLVGAGAVAAAAAAWGRYRCRQRCSVIRA